ncbi:MAG: folate-binding protein YgfZ [Akkermansiaceae bacterium]|nr:folate-binding protein YgfZ [Akkermansiaceae bacterium]
MTAPDATIALSPCTVLRLAGPDRVRFLNGQVTNDVRLASPTRAVFSAVLNAKGQLDAVCWIREHEDAYLLDAPRELRDDLFARLDRYLIADDVTLTDESDQWSLVHLPGAAPDDLAAGERYACPRFDPESGVDGLTPAGASSDPPAPVMDAADLLALRVERGVPAWGAELVPGLLPPEAGLDANAISYEKGCYLGQEVISRMKRAGKTNRHLVQLEVPAGTTAPADLLHDGQAAGTITSVSPRANDGRSLALGYRKRKFEGATAFTAGPGEARVLQRLAG